MQIRTAEHQAHTGAYGTNVVCFPKLPVAKRHPSKSVAAKSIKDIETIAAIQQALLESSQEFGLRNWMIFTLNIHIGRRCGDVLTMRIGDVYDEVTRQIRSPIEILEEKTGKRAKNIELNEELSQILLRYIDTLDDTSPDAPLFPSRKKHVKVIPIKVWEYEDALDMHGNNILDRDGKPVRKLVERKRAPRKNGDDSGCLTTRSYCGILNKVGKKLGIDSLGTHCMRKTFGYLVYQKYKGTLVGGEYSALDVVCGALNHSSTKQTLNYIGLEEEVYRDMYREMNVVGEMPELLN